MDKKPSAQLFCFSPPVMLMTLVIEYGLALYVLWHYKKSLVTRLVVVILILLGTFQLAEYMICGGLGLTHIEWAKLAYVSITVLPPLGVHLVLALAKQKLLPLLIAAYSSAVAYVLYFASLGQSVVARECAPNYALFDTHGVGALLYALYYYGWIIVALALAAFFSRTKPKTARVMRWMAIGYSAFIIPTSLANLLSPDTMAAIPSVMCGFAVLFAIVLVWRVLPLSGVPTIKR